jgi:DNA repair ATPase RecN
MTTEAGENAEVVTDATTENLAPEQQPEVTAPEGTDPGLEAKAEEVDPAKAELEQLRRDLKKRDRVARRQHEEIEFLRAKPKDMHDGSAQTGERQYTQAELDSAVEHGSAVREYTRVANRLVDEGETKHPDFMDEIEDLAEKVGPLVRNGLPSPFMQVVLDTAKSPIELLHYLGTNPDVAGKLTKLNPHQLAVKLDRIQSELAEASKPQRSSAPKPLEPVKGKASDSELGSNLSDAEWMKRREAQVREAWGR